MLFIVFLVLYSTFPLCGMQDTSTIRADQLNQWKQEAIDEIRRENYYDPSEVPPKFDIAAWGDIIQFNAQHQCAVTHIGDLHHYDEENGWHCIEKAHDGTLLEAEQALFADDQDKDKVYLTLLKNTYSSFAYEPVSKTLVYGECTKRLNGYREFLSPYRHSDDQFSRIIVKQDDDSISHKTDWTIDCISLNQSGTLCAIGSLQNGVFRVKLCDSHDRNMLEKKVYQLDGLIPIGNSVIEDIHFMHDNAIRVRTVIPNQEAYQWELFDDRKIKQACMIDCGNNLLVSLAKTHSYPLLYRSLLKGGYRFNIGDPRAKAFMGIAYGQEAKILPEIAQYITSLWYKIDPKLVENIHLIYGSNSAVFPQKNKDALKILWGLEQAPIPRIVDAIKTGPYQRDDFFYAAERGKLWQGHGNSKNDEKKTSYCILKALFNSYCCLPVRMAYSSQSAYIKKFVLDQKEVIADLDGTIAFSVAGQNNHQLLFKPFAHHYYFSDVSGWSEESAQKYIKDKTIQSLENQGNTITISLRDGSIFSMEKTESGWSRMPEHLGVSHGQYMILSNPRAILKIKLPLNSTWTNKQK